MDAAELKKELALADEFVCRSNETIARQERVVAHWTRSSRPAVVVTQLLDTLREARAIHIRHREFLKHELVRTVGLEPTTRLLGERF